MLEFCAIERREAFKFFDFLRMPCRQPFRASRTTSRKSALTGRFETNQNSSLAFNSFAQKRCEVLCTSRRTPLSFFLGAWRPNLVSPKRRMFDLDIPDQSRLLEIFTSVILSYVYYLFAMRIRSACAASNGDAPSIVTAFKSVLGGRRSKQRRAAHQIVKLITVAARTNKIGFGHLESPSLANDVTCRMLQPFYESEDDARVARVNRN